MGIVGVNIICVSTAVLGLHKDNLLVIEAFKHVNFPRCVAAAGVAGPSLTIRPGLFRLCLSEAPNQPGNEGEA